MAAYRLIAVLLVFLVLLPLPPAVESLRLGQWATALSLSHSLLSRVGNARAARGDLAGADRARKISDKLRILGVAGGGIWYLGWDFVWNYSWRAGGILTTDVSCAAASLLDALAEVRRLDSSADRAKWALRNYRQLVELADPLFKSLLRTFSRSGPLREMVLVLHKEATDGELLKDCLEIGAADLEGLLRIAKDLFSSSRSNLDEEEL